jgi:chromosomal replication initiator protein
VDCLWAAYCLDAFVIRRSWLEVVGRPSNVTAIWNSALSRLSSKIAPQNYEMWLRPIECVRLDGDRLLLRAPNQYVRLWFESNYLGPILEEMRREDDRDFVVEFEVVELPGASAPSPPIEAPAITDSAGPLPPSPMHAPAMAMGVAAATVAAEAALAGFARTSAGSQVVSAAEPELAPAAQSSGLNAKYTFETFVAGPSNQLAHAAARAVASPEPPKYNPLFLCGGVGLGKTHLLHAIGVEIVRSRPVARVLYLSGERFMNEYIASIRSGRMAEFRKRYREDCDVLLLDDIQFIANKDATQDEFFHTFNALYEQQRLIVLSADRKPHEIPDIADRLRTRFAWGLMADIEPPELEVRIAILRKKAAAEGIHLPDDVSLYIASAIKSNVRELEGALIRLAAYASLSKREISIEFARETLEGSIARPSEQLSVEQVLRAVASYYQVKVTDLKSERRHKSIAGPRAVAMFLARKLTTSSYPDLGRAFGNKHHTTVLSAVDKIEERLKTDSGLRSEIQAIESGLTR